MSLWLGMAALIHSSLPCVRIYSSFSFIPTPLPTFFFLHRCFLFLHLHLTWPFNKVLPLILFSPYPLFFGDLTSLPGLGEFAGAFLIHLGGSDPLTSASVTWQHEEAVIIPFTEIEVKI